MGKPWAELTSAERMDAILLAVHELDYGEGTAASIAMTVHVKHRMEPPRFAKHGTRPSGRQPNEAVRVTPGIIALRRKGLLTYTRRRDGLSGSADALTEAGHARLREILAASGD